MALIAGATVGQERTNADGQVQYWTGFAWRNRASTAVTASQSAQDSQIQALEASTAALAAQEAGKELRSTAPQYTRNADNTLTVFYQDGTQGTIAAPTASGSDLSAYRTAADQDVIDTADKNDLLAEIAATDAEQTAQNDVIALKADQTALDTHDQDATRHLGTATTGQYAQKQADGSWLGADLPPVTDANTISGAGAPTAAQGEDDFYYRQLDAPLGDNNLWGPKTAGAWPAQADFRSTNAEIGTPAQLIEGDADENDPRLWAGSTLREAIETFEELPASDATLELGKSYFGKVANTYTLPDPGPGDPLWVEVYNTAHPMEEVYITIQGSGIDAVANITIPELQISPTYKHMYLWHEAEGQWHLEVNRNRAVNMSVADDDGKTLLRGAHHVVTNGSLDPMTIKVPSAPTGRMTVRYSRQSAGPLIIEQQDPGPPHLLNSKNRVNNRFTVPVELIGAFISIEGDLALNRWNIYGIGDNRIDVWVKELYYDEGEVIVQRRLADGLLLMWQRNSEGDSREQWDAAEEAEWSAIGEPDLQVPLLESVTVQFRGHATSFTSAQDVVFYDAADQAYDSADWYVIEDSGGGSTGVPMQSRSFSPPVNGLRTVKFQYNGGAQLRGLSAVQAALRADAASTSINMVSAKYFDGTATAPFTHGTPFQGVQKLTLSPTFDFLTVVQAEKSSSGDLVEWATLTEHTAGTEYIVTLPVNADVITSEGAIAGLNYIATPRTDRPDTIATMDDAEFDNNWDILGVFRQSGASIRDLTGTGTLYFNPLIDLSNSRVDEFIDWQTFAFTQDILFALDPASITEWQDYTGNNLVQPAALNDTFTLPEHTRLRATRAGNAVKISLHPLEGTPDPSAVPQLSAVFSLGVDSTAPHENTDTVITQLTRPVKASRIAATGPGESNIWPITKGSVRFSHPLPLAQDISLYLRNGTDIYGVDILQDGTTRDNALIGPKNGSAVSVDDRETERVITLQYEGAIELVVWPNVTGDPGSFTPFEYGFEEISASELTNTYTGRQRVAQIKYPTPLALTGVFQEIDFGVNLTDAFIEFDIRATNDTHMATSSVAVSNLPLGVDNGGLVHWWDTTYVRVRLDDAASVAAGKIKVVHVTNPLEIVEIRVYKDAANGFVVPTGKDLVTPRQLAVTSPTATPDITIIEEQAASYFVNVTPGSRMVLDSVTDATINVVSAKDGLIIAQATGPNPAVTFTEELLLIPQIYTFQTDNNVSSTAFEGWSFSAGTAARQIRMTNESGRKRIIQPTGFYRESVAGGDVLGDAGINNVPVTFDEGQTRSPVIHDHVFNTGGGVNGDVEYVRLLVWQLDPVDRLKFEPVHELHIAMGVGANWNGNEWRVDVRDFN